MGEEHRRLLRNLQALHHHGPASSIRSTTLAPSACSGVVDELRLALRDSRFLPASQAHVLAALQALHAVQELVVPEAGLAVHVFCTPPPSACKQPLLAPVEPGGLKRVLGRVLTLFKTCDEDARRRASGLRIMMFPLAVPRTYPESASESLGPRHLNGGFYMPGRRLIVITRHEEYPKVMLHEVLHHLMGVTGACEHAHDHSLNAAFHVAPETRLLLDEAITETLAVVCHCAFLAAEGSRKALEGMLRQELQWCTAIVQRLARLYDWPARPWREQTNAFCYLFFRCALMQDLDAFAGMWRDPARVAEWLLARGPQALLPQHKNKVQHNNKGADSLRMTRYGHHNEV